MAYNRIVHITLDHIGICSFIHISSADATAHMGNYYNWYTATAGTGTYSSGYQTVAGSSICPKGWTLPTGGDGTASNTTNANVILGGQYSYFGSVGSQGNGGYHWSSAAYDSNNAYSLNFYSSYVYPTHNYGKAVGNSVRCVA